MNIFKIGDKVLMQDHYDYNKYWVDEITIIRDDECKVLFDDGDGPNYDYYNQNILTLIESKL